MHFNNRKSAALHCLALAAILAAGALPSCGGRSARTAESTVPPAILRDLESKSLYLNNAAREALLAIKPDLLTAGDKDVRSERVRMFARATQDPKLWRQLDRKNRFDAILLMGDPASYQPLLKHLLDTKDWKLTFLDQSILLFKRLPCAEWNENDLAAIENTLSKRPAPERVKMLVQLANKLVSVDRAAHAKPCLDEALALDDKSPEVWTALALYHAKFSQWDEALAKAERALSLDPDYQPAMAAKAQLLLGMNRCNEALPLSQKLVRLSPRDPATLYLHAKIAHGAHYYTEEIATLKTLVDLAGKAGQSAAGYRIYLGQAYASDSQAEPALEQFEKALADPEISAEQRSFIKEFIRRIKSRVKL
jgi:tetratricopeptide (TPR) repeat protein